MKRNTTILLFGMLLYLLLPACDQIVSDDLAKDADYLKYGTSFGMCIGYCTHEIQVTSNKIDFKKNGHNMEGLLPEVSLSAEIDQNYWLPLVENIDFDAFKQLDSIIGCPDCADGGAEWIEIKHGGEVYKVIFEYMNEPDAVRSFIGYLRTYTDAFKIEENEEVNFGDRTLIDQAGIIRNSLCPNDCNEFVIGIIDGTDTSYFYDEYLPEDLNLDYTEIEFNGVLKYDSTSIHQQNGNDEAVEVFKARNIRTFNVRSNLD
ncbi:hypothetical protein [Maribellus sediminis]|uniref:hypothetical protein n=1 Tax=Maribellus sediminis TaxID=2696285 RepID=UPI001431EAA9|nr:hypothetical protein [Maribellus sediminis]